MTEIKAKFDKTVNQQGKTVLQFTLDDACDWAIGELSLMAKHGANVLMTIEDMQQRIEMPEEAQDEPLPMGGLLPEVAQAVEVADEEWAAELDSEDKDSADGWPADDGYVPDEDWQAAPEE